MTFLGKILVFLIMVMSLLFLGFSVAVYSANQNWRVAVEKLRDSTKQKMEQRDQDAQVQASLIEDIRREAQDKAGLAAKLETESVLLKEQNTKLEAEKTQLAAEAREAVASMKAVQEANVAAVEDAKKIRTENVEVSRARDQHFGEVVRLTDTLNQQKAEMDRLEARRLQLMQQIGTLEEKIAYAGITTLDPKLIQNPPSVEGKILALNQAAKMYEISLGQDDGIVPGHELKVFRLGTTPRYLGTIKIVSASPDRAVGKLVDGTQQGPIERDDHVATNLR